MNQVKVSEGCFQKMLVLTTKVANKNQELKQMKCVFNPRKLSTSTQIIIRISEENCQPVPKFNVNSTELTCEPCLYEENYTERDTEANWFLIVDSIQYLMKLLFDNFGPHIQSNLKLVRQKCQSEDDTKNY